MSDGQVVKRAGVVHLSPEQLGDAAGSADLLAELGRLQRMTPQERAAAAERRRQERAAERAAAVRVELTLEALVEALGWPLEYLRHVVQRYCGCRDGLDGWETCQHADDEGVAP